MRRAEVDALLCLRTPNPFPYFSGAGSKPQGPNMLLKAVRELLSWEKRPISRRQWLALKAEVGRVCRADNKVLAGAAIERLPAVRGFLPGSWPNGIVFVGCDDVYLRRFAIDLAHSARAHSPEQAVHLHVCDPSPDSLVLLEGLKENQRGLGF